MRIGSFEITDTSPPCLVCEIGINHNGSLLEAKKIVDAAINSGAKIIKHQTHIVDDEMSNEASNIIPPHTKESIFDIMKSCALNEKDELDLMNYVKSKGAVFISSPFSREAANRLAKFEIPAFKIGSGECNNYPLIKHISDFNKPMIISTGMNSIESIKPTVEILRNRNIPFSLLHCTNIYPTPAKLVRLDAIKTLKNAFPDAIIGLSDHTTSNYTCFGAVALGAKIIEKHFTDTKSRIGPDIECSMDQEDLKDMIFGINTIFQAGGEKKVPLKEEEGVIKFAFASVVSIEDIKEGEFFSKKNIWVKRPGNGDFKAREFEYLIGKKAKNFIKKDIQIKKSDVLI